MSAVKTIIASTVLCAAFSVASAQPTVVELTREQVQNEVENGNSIRLRRLVRIASRSTEGELLNIRAFKSNAVFYEFLFKEENGELITIYLLGSDGKLAGDGSDDIRSVASAINAQVASSSSGSEVVASGASAAAQSQAGNAGGSQNSGNRGNSGNSGNGNSGNSNGKGKNN